MFLDKKCKFGFTVAELLITLGIIGVVAVITIPIFVKNLPTKEEEMQKKMLYLIEQIASQMYDNENFYPRTNDVTKQGFMNTDKVSVNGVNYGGVGNNNDTTPAQMKFCRLFARQFDNVNDANITCYEDVETAYTNGATFRSVDGVEWWLPKTTFNNGFAKIRIDVNGKAKGRNCSEDQENCKNPDVFDYYIKPNGTVTLSNPISTENSQYKIAVKILRENQDGKYGEIQNNGLVEIIELNDDGTVNGNYSSNASSFENLKVNKNYRLRVTSPYGYISNWKTNPDLCEGLSGNNLNTCERYGYRQVRITKLSTDVTVRLDKIKKSNIVVYVDCRTSNSPSDCINSVTFKSGCKYINLGENKGDYKELPGNLGNYVYVGPYKGEYEYRCSSYDSDNIINTGTDDRGFFYSLLNRESGDYQIILRPANGYHFDNMSPGDKYEQNVRLGTEDLVFSVTVRPNDD